MNRQGINQHTTSALPPPEAGATAGRALPAPPAVLLEFGRAIGIDKPTYVPDEAWALMHCKSVAGWGYVKSGKLPTVKISTRKTLILGLHIAALIFESMGEPAAWAVIEAARSAAKEKSEEQPTGRRGRRQAVIARGCVMSMGRFIAAIGIAGVLGGCVGDEIRARNATIRDCHRLRIARPKQ
jgi:hypothetical protein